MYDRCSHPTSAVCTHFGLVFYFVERSSNCCHVTATLQFAGNKQRTLTECHVGPPHRLITFLRCRLGTVTTSTADSEVDTHQPPHCISEKVYTDHQATAEAQ